VGRIILSMMLGLGFLSGGAQAEVIRTREVYLHINDVFVPTEKSANGNSYVVVSGMFPNSCYQWNRAEVVHPTDNTHQIRLVANVSEGMCLMVLVPYTKEVSLGNLSAGEHTLRFVNGDDTYFERTMTVK